MAVDLNKLFQAAHGAADMADQLDKKAREVSEQITDLERRKSELVSESHLLRGLSIATPRIMEADAKREPRAKLIQLSTSDVVGGFSGKKRTVRDLQGYPKRFYDRLQELGYNLTIYYEQTGHAGGSYEYWLVYQF